MRSRCDPGVRSQCNRCNECRLSAILGCDWCDLNVIGAISVRSWGAISVRISLELGGLGLARRPELGFELCVELRLVHGLELK